jgi:hypothetical protein
LELGRSSNGEREARRKTSNGVGANQINPCLPFIRKSYFSFWLLDPHR